MAMDRDLIRAFRKIEKTEEKKKLSAERKLRSLEREKVLEELKEAAKRRKTLEKVVLILTVLFTLMIVVIVVFVQPEIFNKPSVDKGLMRIGVGVDCSLKANMRHSACSTTKIKRDDWSDNSKFIGTGDKPFNLYQKPRRGEED